MLTLLFLLSGLMLQPSQPIIHDGFDQAKVGEVFTVDQQCGCNICSRSYVKVSERERRFTGGASSTLVNCPEVWPVERVR